MTTKRLVTYLVQFAVVFALMCWWYSTIPAKSWGQHNVITDPATGCQYIKTDQGLAPRLDKDGRAMCQTK